MRGRSPVGGSLRRGDLIARLHRRAGQAKLVETLPEDLHGSLPTVGEIERELAGEEA